MWYNKPVTEKRAFSFCHHTTVPNGRLFFCDKITGKSWVRFYVGAEMKRCKNCGEEKPIEEFVRDKNAKGGFLSWCRKCHGERARKWREANPDKVHEMRQKQYYKNQEAICKRSRDWYYSNKEKARARALEWHRNNRERACERMRNWYIENFDRERERDKKYRTENADKVLEWNRNYRAKLLGNGGEITAEEWGWLKEFYDYTCLCCGRKEPDINLTLDHVIPLSLGGKNIIENTQPLCNSCNSKKKAKIIDYRKPKVLL